MTTVIFMEGTGCLHGCARLRHNLLVVKNCTTHPQVISKKQKSCVLSIKLHKHITASCFWHPQTFQVVAQEAPSTKMCVLDVLRIGD